ncbi:MAG: hypothetical protein J6C85_01280 [Alphaproteobacteria bacterium]|nr:hypothetical protein [Alphaproteobacteria bacterium]MBP3514924.1 hypothetical protein [Alphaproteobacteria bacterium]
MSEDKSKIPATRIHTDAKPTNGSRNLITSGAVASALDDVLAQTAKRAEADADGNDIGKTYARISDVIFYEET